MENGLSRYLYSGVQIFDADVVWNLEKCALNYWYYLLLEIESQAHSEGFPSQSCFGKITKVPLTPEITSS